MLGLASKALAKSPVPATLIALVVGVLIGPDVLGWIHPEELTERTTLLEHAARLTLGIGLVSVALRIPKTFPRRHGREMLILVAMGMLLMWGISTALVHLVLGLPLALAAVIGAVVTPTDPVAASPIVTGDLAEKHLPERIRNAISFESGANDGLSYLFLFIPFLLLTRPTGEAWMHWLRDTLLWEVGFATAFGFALGYTAAKLLQASEDRGLIKDDWRLVYTAGLALLAIGAGRLVNSDEVLVVFAAGIAFTQVVTSEDRQDEERGQEAVNRFFSIPMFALIGMTIPWEGWRELGWKGLLFAVLLMLLRRPPVLLLLRPVLPSVRGRVDALYMGWFGPIAVAATYYAAMMEHRLHEPLVWHVVSLVICTSVVLHGMTAAPLTRAYGRATPDVPQDEDEE